MCIMYCYSDTKRLVLTRLTFLLLQRVTSAGLWISLRHCYSVGELFGCTILYWFVSYMQLLTYFSASDTYFKLIYLIV